MSRAGPSPYGRPDRAAYPSSPSTANSTTNLLTPTTPPGQRQRPRSRRFTRDVGHREETAGLLAGAAAPGVVRRGSAASSAPSFSDSGHSFVPALSGPGGMLVPAHYDPNLSTPLREADDDLHAPDPPGYTHRGGVSVRGCANAFTLLLITCGIVSLFAAYPIITFVHSNTFLRLIGDNPLVNGSGQVAVLANMPQLVDPKTPESAKTRTGYDGQAYQLVFSDEFETDNRTFYPGDDPYWEAVDLWYGATADLEWYDPGQVTTGGGYMRIKIEQVDPADNHNLTLKSGMVQSWNKLCFAGGMYIEVSLQLPGDPTAAGYWPGIWTMGNLGRAGFDASTDGLWPYTYDSCDAGTLPNQTAPDGSNAAALTNLPAPWGRPQYNDDLSWLPGQRLSACSCLNSDHPGPQLQDTNGPRLRGRGAPEIDVLEAEKCKHLGAGAHGCVSQSAQFAPFSTNYQFPVTPPAIQIWTQNNLTALNDYKGSALQQAVSALTHTPDDVYGGPAGGQGFGVFGFEFFPDPNDPTQSFVSWVSAGQQSYTMTGAAIPGDTTAGISQRIIPHEPMYMIMNLGVSNSFQTVNFTALQFPSELLIDYVRVYQRTNLGDGMVSCDPPGYPTTAYIAKHLNAYTDVNLTSWASSGYEFPNNSMIAGACS